ncbi:MAG: site-specific integrase [Bryobacteraceae bacterium]
MKASTFPALLQRFFTERLLSQLQASPHTVASYRDTFRLLLGYAERRIRKRPSDLTLADLDSSLITSFLADLESRRGNGAQTRNLRLTAVRSFFRFAAYHAPDELAAIQRVLAIPNKRAERKLIAFLERPEIDALLEAPNRSTWTGRRDYAFLLTVVQTGLRLSEITALRPEDVVLGRGACVHCLGKGRKERRTPLTKHAAEVLRAWIAEPHPGQSRFVFPNARGGQLSADGVAYILAKHAAAATTRCPSLGSKRVTPHVLRHTAAMELLQAGVDRAVIALWLGHESVETTQVYLDANLAMKEAALARTPAINGAPPGRYRPDDQLLRFLRSL